MPREDAIRVEGVIVETLANGLFRVELSNGHRLMAWLSRKALAAEPVKPETGRRVTVEVSPFDLSKGSIVGL